MKPNPLEIIAQTIVSPSLGKEQPKTKPIESMWRISICFLVIALCGCASNQNPTDSEDSYRDWSVYLGDATSSHYSTLDQINQDNVAELALAWVYNSGDADSTGRTQIQCNPIVVDSILYATSPGLKTFALNAATGEEIWRFDPFDAGAVAEGPGINRGVAYWEGNDEHESRILYSAGSRIFALNALTGEPILTFGEAGSVDLRKDLGRDVTGLAVSARTPGIIYRHLLIQGTSLSEGIRSAPGHIRAYDVRTGEVVWTFRTIPHPEEFGYDTWPAEAYLYSGGANAWSGLSLDKKRGMVFLPTGSAAFDFWGGNRIGENLFANSVLALDAMTGERKWHFQTVHHDIWDRDLPAAPNLVTVTHEGHRIDAVAQVTKSGHVFLLDRQTGVPLFPVEEQEFPPSDLYGEEAWPTQPIPLKPPPFARQRFDEEDITDISQESHDYVLERFRQVRSNGQFVPPSVEGTIIYPGFDGGAEWGGAGYDPTTGILYVNSNEMPWILTMVPLNPDNAATGAGLYARYCAGCHGPKLEGSSGGEMPALTGLESRMTKDDVKNQIAQGIGFMPSFGFLKSDEVSAITDFLFGEADHTPSDTIQVTDPQLSNFFAGSPYGHTGYNRFFDQDGYPAVKPPWGTLNAINLNTGTIDWSIPLGEFPELTAQGIPQTGTENYGGPVITSGGLIFIAATKDERFRAFNKDSGTLLWETQLPAGGYATPATYAVNGKQYVVIAAGGGKMGTKSGDAYLAFALPE
ncbi:MAG: PQQ-binding-like beta-propeller repeat protein [Bacteroidetes bacterium]|nr:PQQ-binding-like beta-propeller repeat protein [Bacteroidota bacterium]